MKESIAHAVIRKTCIAAAVCRRYLFSSLSSLAQFLSGNVFLIHAMFTQLIIFLREPYFSLMFISNQSDSSVSRALLQFGTILNISVCLSNIYESDTMD